MIFVDSRFEELLLEENGSFSSDKYKFLRINKVCKAGAIVSDKAFPPTNKSLIKKHIDNESVFLVFLNKYTAHENAVQELLELGVKNIIVVYLGTPIHKNGFVNVAKIGEIPERDYILEKIKMVSIGITVFECPINCLDILLDKVEEYVLSDGVFSVYPSFINYRMVDDWRAMIAALPMLDVEKAESLWRKYGDRAVIDVLRDLTDPAKNPSGFGRIACERLRNFFGIPDGYLLGFVWEEEVRSKHD